MFDFLYRGEEGEGEAEEEEEEAEEVLFLRPKARLLFFRIFHGAFVKRTF